MSVFGKTLRHIALATAGFTLGVSQLMAAGISPIPNSQVNGSAQLVNGAIQLTNGSANETGSAFYKTAVNTSKFSTHFTVQLINASADGFTFCLQNNSPTALGSPGQGSNLGFADILIVSPSRLISMRTGRSSRKPVSPPMAVFRPFGKAVSCIAEST
jgi:hypothetical protein